MRTLKRVLCVYFATLAIPAGADECAHTYTELEKTERLKTLKTLLPASLHKGFVNGTQGSYFFITSTPEKFIMTFLTTGLFDLYGIRRDGVIYFCDNGNDLTVTGLGRTQKLFIEEQKLQFDQRIPRQTFEAGTMPASLQKIHNFDMRSLASD